MKKVLLALFLIGIGARLSGIEESEFHEKLTKEILSGKLKTGSPVVFQGIENEGFVLKSYTLSEDNPPRVMEYNVEKPAKIGPFRVGVDTFRWVWEDDEKEEQDHIAHFKKLGYNYTPDLFYRERIYNKPIQYLQSVMLLSAIALYLYVGIIGIKPRNKS